VRGVPNPDGTQGAQLFLFVGDPTVAPVQEVVPDEGVTLPGQPDGLAAHPFRLRVLHFNDLHGRVSRITGYSIQPVLSRIVWRLRELRRRYRNDPHSAIIVLSAGDDFVGDAFDESPNDDTGGYHLYSAAGVDVGVLGNHDFDRGARSLARAIRGGTRFPLLSANLVGGRWLDGLAYPAALLVVKGVRIGIIGLTTRAEIKYRAGSEFRLANPVEAAHNLLPAVRPLCDVLILLSHLGHSLASHTAVVRDAGDVELAESLPPGSVHLIVGGHTHHALNQHGLNADNVVNGIPILQAGARGHFLGEVDVTLRGRCAAVTDARLTCTADLPVAEEFERDQVQPLVARMRSFLARSLGHVADHPDLSTDGVRNEFAAGESAMANFISDGLVARCRTAGHAVDFSMIDGASVNYGLPVGGQLTFGDWLRLMPYADVVRICEISGHQLAALLEDNSRRADRPDEPHVERGFLQFSRQVRYTLALGESRSAARVIEATVGGSPLEKQLERTFLVACTGFVREKAIPWEAQQPNLPIVDTQTFPCRNTDMSLRDEMIAYIREHGGVTEEGGAKRDGRVNVKRET
jgi:5'-nucleotidase/UDP-sugar diphosphatase